MAQVLIGAADAGRVIALPWGSTLAVRLPENPTTGYQWVIAEGADAAPLLLQQRSFNPSSAPAAGAAGERVLIFEAQAQGRAELKLVLKQPWLDDSTADRRFEVQVDVLGSGP